MVEIWLTGIVAAFWRSILIFLACQRKVARRPTVFWRAEYMPLGLGMWCDRWATFPGDMRLWGGTIRPRECPTPSLLPDCLFLHRFQVLGEVEDDACALITKKGVFSEKCPIQNYWICQGVVPSSTDNDLWIDHRYKSSCLKKVCIFVETLCFYNKYYCGSADNSVDVGHYPWRQWLYLRTEMTFS